MCTDPIVGLNDRIVLMLMPMQDVQSVFLGMLAVNQQSLQTLPACTAQTQVHVSIQSTAIDCTNHDCGDRGKLTGMALLLLNCHQAAMVWRNSVIIAMAA